MRLCPSSGFRPGRPTHVPRTGQCDDLEVVDTPPLVAGHTEQASVRTLLRDATVVVLVINPLGFTASDGTVLMERIGDLAQGASVIVAVRPEHDDAEAECRVFDWASANGRGAATLSMDDVASLRFNLKRACQRMDVERGMESMEVEQPVRSWRVCCTLS